LAYAACGGCWPRLAAVHVLLSSGLATASHSWKTTRFTMACAEGHFCGYVACWLASSHECRPAMRITNALTLCVACDLLLPSQRALEILVRQAEIMAATQIHISKRQLATVTVYPALLVTIGRGDVQLNQSWPGALVVLRHAHPSEIPGCAHTTHRHESKQTTIWAAYS
jgi:hypothetical protein